MNEKNEPITQGGPPDNQETVTHETKPIVNPPHATPEKPTADNDQWHAEQRKNWFWQLIPQWAIVVVTGGGVVAAFITLNILNKTMEATKDQAASAKLAAEMAKKSVDVSVTAFQQDQRAWVGVKNIRMIRFEKNQPIIIEITISNSGKTVAREVSSVVHIIQARGKIDINKASRDLAVERSDNLVLFPAAELTRTRESFTPTEEKFASMRSNVSQLYAFGDIKYFDIFGNARLTEFCGMYSPDRAVFILCDQHQNAT